MELQDALKREKKRIEILEIERGRQQRVIDLLGLPERPLPRPNVSSLFKYMSGILCDTPQAFLPVTNFL